MTPLPWVVAPHPDEWLGFWLHRVAETYGLRVRDLLAHAGTLSKATTAPTWARLPPFGIQDLERLSRLLHEPAAWIERMRRLVSPLGRTTQAGYCWHCLVSDLGAQRAPYWRRDWMDPYAGWCETHRRRLAPVDAGELRQLATARSIGALMASLAATPPAPDGLDRLDAAMPAGAAAALQAAMRQEAEQQDASDRPWQRPLRQRVDRIADALMQELRHGRPIAAFASLAWLAPDLKPPVTWSPLPPSAGLLAGVRSQRQRVSLLAVAAHVLHKESLPDQLSGEEPASVVRRGEPECSTNRYKSGAGRKYSISDAEHRTVASN